MPRGLNRLHLFQKKTADDVGCFLCGCACGVNPQVYWLAITAS